MIFYFFRWLKQIQAKDWKMGLLSFNFQRPLFRQWHLRCAVCVFEPCSPKSKPDFTLICFLGRYSKSRLKTNPSQYMIKISPVENKSIKRPSNYRPKGSRRWSPHCWALTPLNHPLRLSTAASVARSVWTALLLRRRGLGRFDDGHQLSINSPKLMIN